MLCSTVLGTHSNSDNYGKIPSFLSHVNKSLYDCPYDHPQTLVKTEGVNLGPLSSPISGVGENLADGRGCRGDISVLLFVFFRYALITLVYFTMFFSPMSAVKAQGRDPSFSQS